MSKVTTRPATPATTTLPAPGFGAFIARVTAKVPKRRKGFEPGDRLIFIRGQNEGTIAFATGPAYLEDGTLWVPVGNANRVLHFFSWAGECSYREAKEAGILVPDSGPTADCNVLNVRLIKAGE